MQDSIYARAKRGDLPHELPLEDITRLSSASLETPAGLMSNADPLYLRLRQLVHTGLLTPTKTEEVPAPVRVLASFGRRPVTTAPTMRTVYYVRAADLRPFLADLGQVGPLLTAWVGVASERAPRAKGTDEPWHVPLVRDFCQVVLASGEIDQDQSGLTAMDIVKAMLQLGLWHRPDKGRPSVSSLERYTRATAGKHVVFVAGKPANCPDHEQRHLRAVAQLVSIYRQAKPETLTRTNPESASSFLERTAG
jgi:hypothetical protein